MMLFTEKSLGVIFGRIMYFDVQFLGAGCPNTPSKNPIFPGNLVLVF